MSEYNPFAAPTSFGDISSPNTQERVYGGLKRLPYFGYGFLMILVQSLAEAAEVPIIVLLMLPVSIVGAMALAYQRCRNIGMNPWWCLDLIVPILNIFVWIRCLAYPEGYKDHKTLDTPAKVVILGILIMPVLIFGVSAASMGAID